MRSLIIAPATGDAWVAWTARLAVACYLCRVLLDFRFSVRSRNSLRLARWFWTLGCLFNLAHLACAFELVHEWSHQQAYHHTAGRTAEFIGVEWGGGIYINYVFTALWCLDVGCWWLVGPQWPAHSRCYFWSVHGVFAFMVFNATVVFGPRFWIAVAAAVLVAAGGLYFARRESRTSGGPCPGS